MTFHSVTCILHELKRHFYSNEKDRRNIDIHSQISPISKIYQEWAKVFAARYSWKLCYLFTGVISVMSRKYFIFFVRNVETGVLKLHFQVSH